MIANQSKGTGFVGAYRYNEAKGQLLETNLAATTERQISAEIGAVRQLRPNLGKAVAHVSLSAAPGEILSDEQWKEITQEYLGGMGFDQSQYIVWRHSDTDHDHIHILANRVTMDGGVVSDSQDFRRQESLMREIEQRHGLTPVRSSADADVKPLTQPEIEKARAQDREAPRQVLQRLVPEAAAGGPTASEFAERLQNAGVTVAPNMANTGHLSGFSFQYDGVWFSGSNLARRFSWPKLQKNYGVSYDQEQDGPKLRQLAESEQSEQERRQRSAEFSAEQYEIETAERAAIAADDLARDEIKREIAQEIAQAHQEPEPVAERLREQARAIAQQQPAPEPAPSVPPPLEPEPPLASKQIKRGALEERMRQRQEQERQAQEQQQAPTPAPAPAPEPPLASAQMKTNTIAERIRRGQQERERERERERQEQQQAPAPTPEPEPDLDQEREAARQAYQEERGEPVLSREVVQNDDGTWSFDPLTVDDDWPEDALKEWDQRLQEINQGGTRPR